MPLAEAINRCAEFVRGEASEAELRGSWSDADS